MTRSRSQRFIAMPIQWATVLGVVGFASGFFGPLILNPSANQGPLLGIFFTGPLGFVIGLVLGLIAGSLNVSSRINAFGLSASSLILACWVLYISAPKPRYRATVIDAKVIECINPALLIANSINRWNVAVATKPEWREVRPDWVDDVYYMLEKIDGVVLELHVLTERKVYEHRKPWNRGMITATPWSRRATNTLYFARYAGTLCGNYTITSRRLFSVVWESSPVWPPNTLPPFLGLHVVEDVPGQYGALVVD